MQKEWEHKGVHDWLKAEEVQCIFERVGERRLSMCGQHSDINRHFKESKGTREKDLWNPKLKSTQNRTSTYPVVATNAV